MEKQSLERRLHLFRYLCVLLSFHTRSLFLSSQPSCFCCTTGRSCSEQAGKGAAPLIQRVLQNAGQAEAPRKTQPRADDGWKGPSVTSDVLNCLSRAKLGPMFCSLHHPCFPASAILLVSKGICCWENELHLL